MNASFCLKMITYVNVIWYMITRKSQSIPIRDGIKFSFLSDGNFVIISHALSTIASFKRI